MKKVLAGVGLVFGGIFILMGATGFLNSETPQAQFTQEQNECDPSYPDVCISPYPPDLDCDEIRYSNFKVKQPDPHGFDRDGDGIGCEEAVQTQKSPQQSPQTTQQSTQQSTQTAQPKQTQPSPQQTQRDCDLSYPTVCIPPYPPDLDCGEISYKRFKVLQPDPHGFDRDKDGIGCES